jgi:hypothetical protein
MTRGRNGLAGAPGRAGGVTILRRVFAVDPLQKQRRVIADTIHDCNPDARPRSIFRHPLALRDTLVEQGGNLRQRSSSMLQDLTLARHRQQS